ncbi:MAG: hypothetical protein ACREBC_18035, partial [Pyrinomonadaceae bacterium]
MIIRKRAPNPAGVEPTGRALKGRAVQVNKALLLTYIFISLLGSVFGQGVRSTSQTQKKPSQAQKKESAIFVSKRKKQLDRLNNALLSEKVKLSSGERVFLFAVLAKIWNDEDSVVAKTLLQKAVDQASPHLTDDPKEKAQRIG